MFKEKTSEKLRFKTKYFYRFKQIRRNERKKK